MDPLRPHAAFSLFAFPYRGFLPLEEPGALAGEEKAPPGSALVWDLSKRCRRRDIPAVADRPPGMALMLILPPANRIDQETPLLEIAELCRPRTVLPFHRSPDPEDFAVLLGRPPADLPLELTDYLHWRGIRVDRETRHLLRRTIELSRELTTVQALSRALYLSRRALGRRFMTRGLPVPSHWLQFSRLLQVSILLQTTDQSLFSIASRLGYPDGFALSNQMERLVGIRPSLARQRLGWEWIVESWLQREADGGSIGLPRRPDGARAKGPRLRPLPGTALPPRAPGRSYRKVADAPGISYRRRDS